MIDFEFICVWYFMFVAFQGRYTQSQCLNMIVAQHSKYCKYISLVGTWGHIALLRLNVQMSGVISQPRYDFNLDLRLPLYVSTSHRNESSQMSWKPDFKQLLGQLSIMRICSTESSTHPLLKKGVQKRFGIKIIVHIEWANIRLSLLLGVPEGPP